MIKLKRAYDKPTKQDGLRILVDRLWPRGLSKEEAEIDLWLKDLAPSHTLRKWFNHDPEKWDEFSRRYVEELEQKGDLVKLLRHRAEEGAVTLVYGAKDEQHNNAIVLKSFVQRGKK